MLNIIHSFTRKGQWLVLHLTLSILLICLIKQLLIFLLPLVWKMYLFINFLKISFHCRNLGTLLAMGLLVHLIFYFLRFNLKTLHLLVCNIIYKVFSIWKMMDHITLEIFREREKRSSDGWISVTGLSYLWLWCVLYVREVLACIGLHFFIYCLVVLVEKIFWGKKAYL